jgi:FKBP-type peptidyl-prolyl cis-trans isomerase (trigger factor)
MTEEKKANNTKEQKFRTLAEARLEKAVHCIQLIAPLADKNRYTYTDEQVKYIVKTLKESVRTVENAFQGKVEKKISLP